ncbi:bing4ct domain-containing protein [Cyclospora cayetanensis]|uniref:Bing4ct domain-containing protein n=1 Tax=Cyclospora cayetanensis TaxID=88456 RepID=A0A1D3CVP3_9EIME|nr:bing4ct domain-containing protein [Cyclospora cayetanensis]
MGAPNGLRAFRRPGSAAGTKQGKLPMSDPQVKQGSSLFSPSPPSPPCLPLPSTWRALVVASWIRGTELFAGKTQSKALCGCALPARQLAIRLVRLACPCAFRKPSEKAGRGLRASPYALAIFLYLQSRTAKKSRAILKQQKRLEIDTRESKDAISTLATEQEGILEAEGLEKTYKFKQADILEHLDAAAKKKAFRFSLSFGPYAVDVSRGGREMLFGGQKGSLGLLDCEEMKTLCEINVCALAFSSVSRSVSPWIFILVERRASHCVKETVRAVHFLQNHTLWAAAQKKYVYIYDNQGIEIHCLRDIMMTYALDFLPYHYLMVSVGEFGELVYYDISTGQIAAKHKTRRGPCSIMQQNPTNAVMHLGHTKGTVTLWTPNLGKPAVEMFCHKGKVTAVAAQDNYMITAGVDGKWKLWDLRKYEAAQSFSYFGAPPSSVAISQTGLVALGFGSHLQVWKDVLSQKKASLYMTHEAPGEVRAPDSSRLHGVRGELWEGARRRGEGGLGQVEGCSGRRESGCGERKRILDRNCYPGSSGIPCFCDRSCSGGDKGGARGKNSCFDRYSGAGLANFDSRDANPFETKKVMSLIAFSYDGDPSWMLSIATFEPFAPWLMLSNDLERHTELGASFLLLRATAQRREREVHSLLEKLPADMISLDSTPIGTFDKKRKAAPVETPLPESVKKTRKPKKKQRGRGTAEKRNQKSERERLIKKRHQTALRMAAAKESKPTSEGDVPAITGALARADCVSPPVPSLFLLRAALPAFPLSSSRSSLITDE